METIDGYPLSPQSKARLAAIMRAAGVAQGKQLPSARADLEDVAVAVLDAFKVTNEVVDGTWRPKRVIRLAGGALVAPHA